MFDLVVNLMALLAGVFILFWWRLPEARDWFERPKFQMMEEESRRHAAGSLSPESARIP